MSKEDDCCALNRSLMGEKLRKSAVMRRLMQIAMRSPLSAPSWNGNLQILSHTPTSYTHMCVCVYVYVLVRLYVAAMIYVSAFSTQQKNINMHTKAASSVPARTSQRAWATGSE